MRVMVLSNIFPPHVRGGYELGLLEVARAFVQDGHEVEVVTSTVVGSQRRTRPAAGLRVRDVFGPVLAYEADLSERLESSPVWRHYRTEALGGVLPDNIVALRREIERFRPDRIWIGNPLGLGPVGIFETVLSAGVPVVVHLMDDIDRYLTGYRRPLHWLPRVARLKRSLTAVSCAAHVRDMNSIVGEYGTHHVVLNGIDFSIVTAAARPGRHGGPLRLVYFGQVEPMKGIPQLVDGIARFAAMPDAPRFALDIIGPASASYAASLAEQLAARGLADAVRLVGSLEKRDLLTRLAEYDAAILLLKLDEPFGYAWLEAAAAGLPVIVTKGRVVSQAFPSSYPLFVADRDDPASVASSLQWCVANTDALAAIGTTLRRHLFRQCDAPTAVNPRYLSILERATPPRTRTDPDALLSAALTVDAYALSAGV
jgi:glycosyltransferase involved in cell wall biosynthesis